MRAPPPAETIPGELAELEFQACPLFPADIAFIMAFCICFGGFTGGLCGALLGAWLID